MSKMNLVTKYIDPLAGKLRRAVTDPLVATDHLLNRIGAHKVPTVPFVGESVIKAEAGKIPIRDLTGHRGKARYLLSELLSAGGRAKALGTTSNISALGKDRLNTERTYKLMTGALGAGAGAILAPGAKSVLSPLASMGGEYIAHAKYLPSAISTYGDDLMALSKTIDSKGTLPLMALLSTAGLKRGRNLGQAIIDRRARIKVLDKLNKGSLGRDEMEVLLDAATRRGRI
jgi:hypothetical protein